MCILVRTLNVYTQEDEALLLYPYSDTKFYNEQYMNVHLNTEKGKCFQAFLENYKRVGWYIMLVHKCAYVSIFPIRIYVYTGRGSWFSRAVTSTEQK